MYITLSIESIKKKSSLVKLLQFSHVDQISTNGRGSEYELSIWFIHMYRYLTLEQKKKNLSLNT